MLYMQDSKLQTGMDSYILSGIGLILNDRGIGQWILPGTVIGCATMAISASGAAIVYLRRFIWEVTETNRTKWLTKSLDSIAHEVYELQITNFLWGYRTGMALLYLRKKSFFYKITLNWPSHHQQHEILHLLIRQSFSWTDFATRHHSVHWQH